MLSTGAFNALLKTLEEPPAHVKFIFATTELHKIPARSCRAAAPRVPPHPFRDIRSQIAKVAARRSSTSMTRPRSWSPAPPTAACATPSAPRPVVAFAGTHIAAADVAAVLGLVDRDLIYAGADAIWPGIRPASSPSSSGWSTPATICATTPPS